MLTTRPAIASPPRRRSANNEVKKDRRPHMSAAFIRNSGTAQTPGDHEIVRAKNATYTASKAMYRILPADFRECDNTI
jgi:hypothetical protein